jgi:hypothetical protein
MLLEKNNQLAIFTYIKAEINTIKKLHSDEVVANILDYLINREDPVTYNNGEHYRKILKDANSNLELCLLEPRAIPTIQHVENGSLEPLKQCIKQELKKERHQLRPLSDDEFCRSLWEAIQAANKRYQQRLRQADNNSALIKWTSKFMQSIAENLKPDVKKGAEAITTLYKNAAQHQTNSTALLEDLKTAAREMKGLDTAGEKIVEGFLHDLKDAIKIRPIEDIFKITHVKGDVSPLCDALLKAKFSYSLITHKSAATLLST